MIVLDTHIWLWWVNEDAAHLKPAWRALIENADQVGISAISCFEVAWLEGHGRIALPCPRAEWFAKALDGSGIQLLAVSPEIASLAVDLSEHHTDPQDRIIIATAIATDASILSADSKFRLYDELRARLIE